MCKYQEALSILRHINAMIWELGMQWEQYLGYTCDGGGTYPDIFYRIEGSKMYEQNLFLIFLDHTLLGTLSNYILTLKRPFRRKLRMS